MNYSRVKNSLKQVFQDYTYRRSASINALTVDAEKFYEECDPEEANLCLYAYPDGTWELICPVLHCPPEIPEPVLGINFAKKGMEYNEWLLLIAAHTDSWLLSVSFFFASRSQYNCHERMELFDMINELPTVREAVIEYHMEKKKRKRQQITSKDEDGDEVMEGKKCGECGKNNGGDEEFWIRCYGCKIWFHYKCVKMTSYMSARKRRYRCPACMN